MEVRYAPNDEAYQRMTTAELRRSFVVDNLFAPNVITMVYSDVDRVIVGSAVPLGTPLKLESSKKEMAADFFAERREIGIINIGGEGKIRIDGTGYAVTFRDLLYVRKRCPGNRVRKPGREQTRVILFCFVPRTRRVSGRPCTI